MRAPFGVVLVKEYGRAAVPAFPEWDTGKVL